MTAKWVNQDGTNLGSTNPALSKSATKATVMLITVSITFLALTGLSPIAYVMILHYNTTLTPSSKAIYSGTKYYDTHIEFHSLFLDVSSTDV